jgi:hypothetical protein
MLLNIDPDVRTLRRLASLLGGRRDPCIGRTFVLFRGNGRRGRPINTDERQTQPMAVLRPWA